MKLDFSEIPSPLGPVLLAADPASGALCALDFADCRARMLRLLALRGGAPDLIPTGDAGGYGDRIRAYFGGRLDALDDVPVDTGGTPFQRQVWQALRRIPPGEARSYADVARAVRRPRAVRAVGAANGRNPVALVVPCHRVIGADGALTGYAGGLERKRWLLRHEGVAV
jgi:methylated-DNA-[protein]-cysteine S-methyltransferase